MDFLAPVIRSLIAGNIKTTVERTRNQAICVFIGAVALVLAIAFFCVVFYLLMIRIMDPLWAALIGLVFWLIVAVVAFVVYKVTAKRKRRTYEAQLEEQKASLMAASALAAMPMLGKKKTWVAALPILGLAALYFFDKTNKKQ